MEWSAEEKLTLLRAKLTGKAARILAVLDLRGTPVTFDILVAELERHYVGEHSEWVAKLRDVRREEGESLDDLAIRISLYSKRAYCRLQPDLGLQLYLALRESPLGDKLFEVKDQPLPEVLKKAKSYEAHLLAINQPVISHQNVAAMYPSEPGPSQVKSHQVTPGPRIITSSMKEVEAEVDQRVAEASSVITRRIAVSQQITNAVLYASPLSISGRIALVLQHILCLLR
jgi:hypothetical protein